MTSETALSIMKDLQVGGVKADSLGFQSHFENHRQSFGKALGSMQDAC